MEPPLCGLPCHTNNEKSNYKINFLFQGGWDGANHLNSGEMYEPDIDQWSSIARASTARWDAAIAVEGDKLYVVGGCDRNSLCTLETECYDPEKKKWTKVAPLPVATHGIKCSTIQVPNKLIPGI